MLRRLVRQRLKGGGKLQQAVEPHVLALAHEFFGQAKGRAGIGGDTAGEGESRLIRQGCGAAGF